MHIDNFDNLSYVVTLCYLIFLELWMSTFLPIYVF